MDLGFLHLAMAFGLAAAAGLNTTLPLLVVSLAQAGGLLHLAAPYDGLGAPPVLTVLVALVVVELLGDKLPYVDNLLHVAQVPLTLAAGAVLADTQATAIPGVPPLLLILLGLLTAGGVHLASATMRPVLQVVSFGFGGAVLSLVEDAGALLLALIALLLPPLAPFLVCILGVVWVIGMYLILRSVLRLAARGAGAAWQAGQAMVDWLRGQSPIPANLPAPGAGAAPSLPGGDIWDI
jgi:hypothetical protein